MGLKPTKPIWQAKRRQQMFRGMRFAFEAITEQPLSALCSFSCGTLGWDRFAEQAKFLPFEDFSVFEYYDVFF